MYQKTPSEILRINDDFIAFCFDEVAFYIMNEAIDKDGNFNWNKFKWKDVKRKTNKDFIEFVKKQK